MDAPPNTSLRAFVRELPQLGFPQRYPLVQFPNLPLAVAIVASLFGSVLSGTAHDYASAVGTVGMIAWAWLELTQGVNAFRRILGLAVLVSQVVNLSRLVGA